MKKKHNRRFTAIGKIVVHAMGIIPLIILYIQWYTYSFVDEINEMTHFTGKGSLIFLMLMMAVTPLITISGWSFIAPLRKLLGMYAFLYATVHLVIFITPTVELNALYSRLAVQQRYALAGTLSWLIMLPLALTSNKLSQKKLKRNWKKLHKLVYAAGVLAIIHYFWLVKPGNYQEPIQFGLILALLFVFRVPVVRKYISNFRRKRQRKKTS